MRVGMALEELKSQSKLPDLIFREAVEGLDQAGNVIQKGPTVKMSEFEIQFSPEQKKLGKNLLDQFQENPTLPPSVAECKTAVGEDVYNALMALNELKQVSAEVVFRPEDYQIDGGKAKEEDHQRWADNRGPDPGYVRQQPQVYAGFFGAVGCGRYHGSGRGCAKA